MALVSLLRMPAGCFTQVEVGGSNRRRRAVFTATWFLHGPAYNFINGLLSVTVSKADKLELFIKYGWVRKAAFAIDSASQLQLRCLSA